LANPVAFLHRLFVPFLSPVSGVGIPPSGQTIFNRFLVGKRFAANDIQPHNLPLFEMLRGKPNREGIELKRSDRSVAWLFLRPNWLTRGNANRSQD
jgi:hypothetical protein